MPIRYGGVIAGQEEIDAVTEVLQGQSWSAGEVTARFENRFANYVGTKFAIGTNSGSSALLLTMVACLEPFGRVIIPALQFPTLYSAASWGRHYPIIMDIDPQTLNLDVNKLRSWLQNPKNRADAVYFVHVAGNPAGIGEVAELCKEHNMLLFEDCCEALGSTSKGRMAGSWGDASVFSTHAAHHISTGEGGMVCTSNEDFAQKVRQFRDWGRDVSKGYDGYNFIHEGFNLRPTDIGSALGLVQFDRLSGFNAARRNNAFTLSHVLRSLGCEVPVTHHGDYPAWYTQPVLTGLRDDLEIAMQEAQVETRRLLCGNLVRMPIANHRGSPGSFPGAEDAWHRGLWLPVHPSVTKDDLDTIIGAARKVLA
jgi:dTDP-4-amino-4,6-dideoxygalactose transaminase